MVNNLHIKCVTVAPYEADTPLIIYTEGTLACPIPSEEALKKTGR